MKNPEESDFQNKTMENSIQTLREQFKTEIENYEALLKQLEEVDGLKLETVSPKVSLAFLIEEIKNKNPEDWQNELKGLSEKIGETNNSEGKVGVSWLLSERIGSVYLEFLKERTDNTEDESLKGRLTMIIKMAENWLEFNRNAREKGESAAFGGVSLDYVHGWHYYIEK